MKNIIGVVLIVIGIAALAYQGFTYTKQEKIAEIGDVKLTTEKQKTVYFPPLLGGLFVVAGIVIIVIRKKG